MQPGQIVADNVSRRFRVNPHRNLTLKEAILRPETRRTDDIWALKDVSFEVEPGASIGFIGRNGSGKTTLLRLIAGIFAPSSGRLEVGGTVGSLLELGAGFHPDFSGRENIFLSGSIYGLKRSYVRERLDEIVSFAELEQFIDLPVRTYSSGMHMRLGFAIAVHVDADILLLDEVFAVGDEAFQRKCIDKILQFKQRGGTVCFVSHSASAVERLCERAILLT
jgi:ABC-2 type transport system ATP-binding protein